LQPSREFSTLGRDRRIRDRKIIPEEGCPIFLSADLSVSSLPKRRRYFVFSGFRAHYLQSFQFQCLSLGRFNM
jgi:hypothetical protein